jgi:hypothetical protein
MNTFALACVQHTDAEGFNFNVTLDEVYTTAGDGYWSDVSKDVRVTDMGMFVNTTDEEYGHGDFYVLYDEGTWNIDNDGLIYTDSAFKANVRDFMRDVLLRMDVDDEVANKLVADISYSEQGMQDYGRVSFDAYALGDFLRDFYKQYA